ncbi:MAG: hypothetical protein NTV29_09240 [Planctomycetota bacterium]|nr:hypothetical protein [Planctomycetota bacterium]
MKRAVLALLLIATTFCHIHVRAQDFEPIGIVDAVFGAVEDNAFVFGNFDGTITSGVYPAAIEDEYGYLACFEVEIDGDTNTIVGCVPSDMIPNNGTPMQVRVYSDDSYSSFVSLLVYAADPPVYPGTPHQPKIDREPWDPTKIPVFRGGDDFTPSDGEIPVDKDGNVKIGSTGPSINTDPEDPNVKKKGPHQIIEIPDGLEIVQQGIKPDKTLKTHGVIRPTRPMKPDEFKALVKKIVSNPFEAK